MAAGELTGGTKSDLRELKAEYQDTPLSQEDNIPFETAFCLKKIGKQPDEYDGPQRFCKRRAAKKDEDDYDGGSRDKVAYGLHCPFHGGDVEKHGHKGKHTLENPLTVSITHGAYAEDEHLKMDFTDDEQELYDSIMEDWPEIYDWPDRSDDPARYRILRRVAVNEVRALREEEYLDARSEEGEGEVYQEPEYDEDGVIVGYTDTENPLAREYRLLMSEVTNQMKELGLTPKERQKMDTLESQADKDDALTEVADSALSGDEDYDPTQFDG